MIMEDRPLFTCNRKVQAELSATRNLNRDEHYSRSERFAVIAWLGAAGEHPLPS